MSKALPWNNKIFDDIMNMTFFMTSSSISGSVRVKKVENRNFFVFHPICLKFGIRGNFEMLITKRRPRLTLEDDLSKKLQFSNDFSQNYTKHSSTIALPWQLWMRHGTGLYSKLKPISILKVTTFEVPTAYRFSTAEGRTSLWAVS